MGAAFASSSPLLNSARNRWEQVAQKGQAKTQSIGVAGRAVRLHFGDATIEANFWPAIQHLAESTDSALFDIYLWDAKTSGVPLPQAPAGVQSLGAHGHIEGLPSHERGAFNIDSGVLALFDEGRKSAYVVVRDASNLPHYERAAPLRALLAWLGDVFDYVLTHAAAIGTSDGAALLVGRGGSGKSTTSLAGLLAGLDFVGDDYLALAPGAEPNSSVAWSLYRSAKCTPRSFELYPQLKAAIALEPDSRQNDKFILWADQLKAGNLVRSLPVRTVLLPRIGDGSGTRLKPATSREALSALAPSTLFQLSGQNPHTLARLAQLTSSLPAYHLELAPDSKASELIVNLLKGLN